MSSQAGILASKTRVLFQSQEQQSLMLANTNTYPVLLQSWIDQGNADPETPDMPFLVVPPLSKIPAGAVQGIRIIYNGQHLPQDRESVFWLNLYEMPFVKTASSTPTAWLSLAMNTQLKVFYRPKQLQKLALADLAKQLSFYLIQHEGRWLLRCDNPTAYHASLFDLYLIGSAQHIAVPGRMDMMSYPFSQKDYAIDLNEFTSPHYDVQFRLVDDDGQQYLFKRPVQLY
jgi:P pilus assembly chaperone PapD